MQYPILSLKTKDLEQGSKGSKGSINSKGVK